MEEPKTLLKQISEKESELNKRLEQAALEAERITAEARRKSKKTLDDADATGRALARERYQAGKAEIDREVEGIRIQASKEAQALRESGDKNLSAAVELISRVVTYH